VQEVTWVSAVGAIKYNSCDYGLRATEKRKASDSGTRDVIKRLFDFLLQKI